MAEKGSSIPDMENNIPIENGHDVPHNDSTYVDPDSDQSKKEANAIQVDWDGEGDPRNPLNWGEFKRYSQVFVVSAITLLTYVYIPVLMAELMVLRTRKNGD